MTPDIPRPRLYELKNLDIPLSTRASESTLLGIKSQTDKLTFDINNYLKVALESIPNPPNLDVALSTRASESTLSGIKLQTDKLTFDTNNYLRVNVSATVNPSNLDVALSTRASESTLSALSNKFPSAVALGDSLSNPTTTIIGVANLGWDGTYWRRMAVDTSGRLRVVAESVANPSNLDMSLTSFRQMLYGSSRYASDSYDVLDTTSTSTTDTSWTTLKEYSFYLRLWPVKSCAYFAVAGIQGYIDTSGQTLYVRIRSYRTGITSATFSITSTSATWVYPTMTVYGSFNEWEGICVDAYVTGGTGYITQVWIFFMPLNVPYAMMGRGGGFLATPLMADANSAVRVSDFYVFNPGNAETFTTTPLAANTTYYGPSRDFANSRLSTFGAMGYADQPSATDGVYIQLSLDNINWDYKGATTTLTAAGAVSLAQVVTARYARIVWVNGDTAQTAFRLGGRYMIAGSENPPISLELRPPPEPICINCGRDMTETSDFFVEDGKVFCPKCYANKRWNELPPRDRATWVKTLKAWLKHAREEELERIRQHAPDQAEVT